MRYLALACDYDGTIARNGRVASETLNALERVRESGRKLLLVTGRELGDLRSVFPELDLFDRVVAENGALLYTPRANVERPLGEPPPLAFVEALRRRYVPVSVGRVIVATWEPHERAVLETIRDLGLELHVIFNKGAVMVLPAGISKASGLIVALTELGLSAHNVVGAGDAENDHAFLATCECSVAVANALPTIKDRADRVTYAANGAGVAQLIEALLETDLAPWEPSLKRRRVLLGTRRRADGVEEEFVLPPYGTSLFIAGSSGSGKSTLATGVLERILEQGYQCCVIDPEGDYGTVEGAVTIGTPQRAPPDDEVIGLLETPETNTVVNLMGERMADRPAVFARLLGRLHDLQTRVGRPHWLVIDEAHHVAPSSLEPAATLAPESWGGYMAVTVEPGAVAAPLLSAANVLVTLGDSAVEAMSKLAAILGAPAPDLPAEPPPPGEALVWDRRSGEPPFLLRIVPPRSAHERHVRKYAEGELGPERSFYFRGPDAKLNLRAQNLILFNQIAEGVDDRTWLHHLRNGDYSTWFRAVIKDGELADEAARIEARKDLPASTSRALMREAIERRYTVPA